MKKNMAYVMLYENFACTRELKKDSDGYYVLKKETVSNNAISPLKINIYLRNLGDHPAYNVSITLKQGSASFTQEIPKILPRQVKIHKMSVEIPRMSTKIEEIKGELRYDNI